MRYIEQTNRTILFEEINPNINNLYTLIGDTKGKESLSDEEIKEIDRYLTVKSYRDFENKFRPFLYMMIDLEKEKAVFSQETPSNLAADIINVPLTSENKLVSLLLPMLDAKPDHAPRESLSDIANYLFPEQDTETFIRLRREIKECFLRNEWEKVTEKLDWLTNNYSGSLLQLQLFLMEAKYYLNSEECGKEIINLRNVGDTQIQIQEISRKFREMEPQVTVERGEEFEAYIREYLNRHNIKNGQWMFFNLLASCGHGMRLAEECATLYNQSLEFYGKIIIAFWKHIKPILQTMLGIKAFFEQYTVKSGAMPPVLLITNCTVELLQKEKYRNDLKIYLETVNLKNFYSSTIWYAIIPRIKFIHNTWKRPIRERFMGNEQAGEEPCNSMEAVQLLLNILGQYRIQSFVSTCPSEENNFISFADSGMDLYEDSFQPFEKADFSEYIIPCIPNFTIIPRDHAKLILGRKYYYEEFGDGSIRQADKKTIWLSGLYMEASYVAAGLLAVCQCPTYLSMKYPGAADPDLPGVAYRITEDNHHTITSTTMKKELFTYSGELLEDIHNMSYGVILGPFRHGITILSDNTEASLHGDKDCIATVQTMTYIERIIRHATQDYRSNLITEFFQNRPDSVRSSWMKNQSMVNSILKTGETLEHHINEKEATCVIEIGFHRLQKQEKVKISR